MLSLVVTLLRLDLSLRQLRVRSSIRVLVLLCVLGISDDVVCVFFFLFFVFFFFFFFFFFQAEDGIRDTSVTGVQTCALPIYRIDFLYPGHHPAYLF